MGCWPSRVEREEAVSRCKARVRYMKQLVRARHAFAAAHALYLRSLRSTGSALLQFAAGETQLQRGGQQGHRRPPPPAPAPSSRPDTPLSAHPPPLSPSSDTTWTSMTASPLPPPPPPPPPVPQHSSWDFWDPFAAPQSSRSVTEEEWDEATTCTVSEVAAESAAASCVAAAAPPVPSIVGSGGGFSKGSGSSELAMVVSRHGKDLEEIIRELDEYFLKAAEAGGEVSLLLEVPSSSGFAANQGLTGKVCGYGRSLSPLLWPWGSSSYSSTSSGGFCRLRNGNCNGVVRDVGFGGPSHCSTLEKLCAWEKKLYTEVKNAERIKSEHDKRASLLRRQEAKGGGDYLKVEKNRKEMERLESKMMVAAQAIDATSSEIAKLRESELFPQLLDLVSGLRNMWRGMYECHQVQIHIVQQLEYLATTGLTSTTTNNTTTATASSASTTSEVHRQSTSQLELEAQQWHSAFCGLINSQRDYAHSLTGWLRLSLFQFHHHHQPTAAAATNPRKPVDAATSASALYALCDEWQLALDRVPDRVASEGIKSFLTIVHSVVMQQAEEFKQRKRSEAAFRDLEKRTSELRVLEGRQGPYDRPSPAVAEKRARVEALRPKAEDERGRYDKAAAVTRAMTLNSLQTGFPNVFQAVTGFSNVCAQAFEAVHGRHHQYPGQIQDPKRLLT